MKCVQVFSSGLLMVAAALACGCPAAYAVPYQFTTIRVPFVGATATVANGINNAGQIVGYFTDGTGDHAFMDNAGVYSRLPFPPADLRSEAYGNSGTQVVGDFTDDGGLHGFVDNSAGVGIATINAPGANGTSARGVNAAGTVVGTFDNAAGLHGFIDNGGAFTTLDAPGGVADTLAYGINNTGFIIGTFIDGAGNTGGFVRTPGGAYVPIALPPGQFPGVTNLQGRGIDNVGDIVGAYTDANGDHGFVGMSGVYTALDAPFAGTTDTDAFGINDPGDIVGSYFANGMTLGFLATPVPEPSSLFMLGTALGVLGVGTAALRRRRPPQIG
jgi:probable HAF family extracellular repeat protein